MSALTPGIQLAKSVTSAAALGFVPVAVHFRIFDLLVAIGKPATGREVLAEYQQSQDVDFNNIIPCLQLIDDTLYAMAGLGFVDMTDEQVYYANEITKHLMHNPSAQHGALHFTTEALLAGAFLFRRLESNNFQYPFQELQTPVQYAYSMMGNSKLAQQHTYDIMAAEGRMDSFNRFMVGKFLKTATTPDRLKQFGYDLGPIIQDAKSRQVVAMVDIGGGRGEMMLEFKEAFPELTEKDLVVQEFNDKIRDIPGITLSSWNYKDPHSAQPIQGAGLYHLAHILHNLPDLDAARLLQKVSQAMNLQSRLLIHEFAKNVNNAKMHASMIVLFGGRERSATEWRQLAALAGLQVTFEAYPDGGEGLVEMRKLPTGHHA
ncbi:putative O-methyltransferase [Aspergillus homomorphus CBS 101889]|uniref:O-methyltransferase n=1 Tax=Aspergillus homomorphus (strain CBS 101889) TaxID=1450537 RepID=A0A395HGT2_ASPHC|nr:O-methyltransferase [Aspergillus homomorphus CBS 101889]RAL07122.1 O-methyltransferase [Aspergillus homomorphus CBS 101889]